MTQLHDPIFDGSNPHAMSDDSGTPCLLDASCVRVVLLEPRLCNNCGDETGKTATHTVFIDLVNNGHDIGINELCLPCANEFAERLRASLPEEKE